MTSSLPQRPSEGTQGLGPLDAQKTVLDCAALRSREKLVLIAIMSHWSRSNPRPWAGIARLARLTSLDRKTVMRAITGLRAKGAIVGEPPSRGSKAEYDLSPVFEGLPSGPAAGPAAGQHQGSHGTSPSEGPVPPRDVAGPTTGQDLVPSRDPKRSREEAKEDAKGLPRKRDGARPPRSSSKRAVPIPPDWAPTDSHRELAARHGLDLELEATGFLGYFEGQVVKSPNGRFTTWLTNSVKRDRGKPQSASRRMARVSADDEYSGYIREAAQ